MFWTLGVGSGLAPCQFAHLPFAKSSYRGKPTMRHRLPSLNALRDFEAVGRHGSISAAARELSVSPSAVSRQVVLLESHFRTQLFDRTRRGLSLTDTGRRYFAAITDAFDRIDAAS